MPAYNAEKTLEQTYAEIPREIVDEVILTDDCSRDGTVEKARELGIKEVLIHPKNRGYGGNQKTCYNRARLPIYAQAHRSYGIYYRQRRLSGGFRIPHSG